MSWFDRFVKRIQDDYSDDYSDEADLGEEVEIEPPGPLAKLMGQVMEYREQELRDLRAKAYEAGRKAEQSERDLSLMTYERNEALQRIAKIYPILNKKQQAQLTKPPVALKFGPPPLLFLSYDEHGKYRPIEVPPPAKMETVQRKGKGPQFAGQVLNSDRRTGRGE